ncbi:MAG TPA: prephenate dehydrogenase/arogenate dehydrogenase family protein [Vicinamibacterales bacterium]
MNESADGGFRRIGIVGVGLIGGSIAFATRRAFPGVTIVGVDREDVVDAGRQLGALQAGATDLGVLDGCDLIVLAAPVRQNVAVLARLPDAVRGPAIVTDAGSTKRVVVDAARHLPAHLTFIGGHPLAGSARAGLEASRADLFERRPWLLTPAAGTPRDAVERLAAFLAGIGAMPLELDPDQHDRVLAFTSHLPQLTASALMHVVGEAVGEAGLRLAGGGLADTTRVAASPASIWTDICATNADEILPALDALITTLQQLRADLDAGASIDPLFTSAQRWRAKVR